MAGCTLGSRLVSGSFRLNSNGLKVHTSHYYSSSVVSGTPYEMSAVEKLQWGAAIDANRSKLLHVHDVMSLVLGTACGILALEAYTGAAFFVATTTLVNAGFYMVCCEGKGSRFFQSPIKEIFIDTLGSSVAGFVMMWCLVYALVR